MDYHLLAREILDLVGGPDNIESFTNCMTRLRLNLIRPETADAEAINGLAGVLGVVEGKELQVVVGPGHAERLWSAFGEVMGSADSASATDTDATTQVTPPGTAKRGVDSAVVETEPSPVLEGDTDIADQGSKQSPQSSPLTQRQIDIRAFIQQQRDAKKELFTSREIKTTVGSTSRETMRKVFDSAQSPKTHTSQTLKDETMTKNSSSSTNMRLRDFIQSQRDKVKQQQVTQYECLAVKDSEDLLALDSCTKRV